MEQKLRIIIIFIVCVSLLFVIALFLARVGAFPYIILAFSTAILYLIGYICFERKLSRFMTNISYEMKPKKGIFIIKRVFQVSLICLIIVVLSITMVASFIQDYETTVKVGGFNYMQVFVDIGLIGLVGLVMGTLWYSTQVTYKLFSKELEIRAVNSFLKFPTRSQQQDKNKTQSDPLPIEESI